MGAANFQATAQRGAAITWELSTEDPEGDWVNATEFPTKTVLIEGGQATLYGCMFKDGMEVELTDALGNPIVSPGLFTVTKNPLFIRPKLITVDPAAKHVTVSIIGSR